MFYIERRITRTKNKTKLKNKTKKLKLKDMAQVSLNTSELKTFVNQIIENNRYIQEKGMMPVAINVEGDHGLGKTTVISQIADELNLDFVKINVAQLDELSDLVGFPIKEYQVSKTVNGQTKYKWVTEIEAEQAIKDPSIRLTGQKRTSYAPPEWIANKSNGGILLLDDYTRGSQIMMQACMDLIYTQEYYSWKLPKDWHIILTTNPDNGDYQVTSMDEAQKTRFISCKLKFDVDCWAKWAEDTNMDSRCINFTLKHPEIIGQKTNPRSITTFFNSISGFENFADHLPIVQMIGEGSIGPEATTLFTTFIHNKLDQLPHPKEIMDSGINSETAVNKLITTIGQKDSYRADIASILTTRIVNYSITFSKDNKIDDKYLEKVEKITTSDALTVDLKYMFIRNLMKDAKRKFQKLLLKTEILELTNK